MIKICKTCKKRFFVYLYRIKIAKFCSKKCWYFTKKGKHFSSPTEFKKGKKSGHWKGGKIIRGGYISIYQPNHPFANKQGYVREHRLIIEKQIDRYLLPCEKTHHLKEKTNNHPKMLMAFICESVHQHFHKNPNNIKSEEIIFDGRQISRKSKTNKPYV